MGQVFLYNTKDNSSNNDVLSYDVVCQATEPDKKEGRIWIESSVPMTYLEWNNKVDSNSPVGYVYIAGTPGGNDPSSSNGTLDIFNILSSGVTNRMKITGITCKQVQGSVGNWMALNAYVCHSNTWVQFATPGITPIFTYTGNYKIVDDNDNEILDFTNWTDNWKIRFLTSGTLKFTRFNNWDGSIDLFLVGGGGGGGASIGSENSDTYEGFDMCYGGGGGGGGYAATYNTLTIELGTSYSISIGSGGSGGSSGSNGTSGGLTTAFGKSVAGGNAASNAVSGSAPGGTGGNNGGAGNIGGNGKAGSSGAITTREFGISGATPYAGGGGGGGGTNNYNSTAGAGGSGGTGGGGAGGSGGTSNGTAISGTTNTGGGGGGGGGSKFYESVKGASGGSGIVIIRNARG